MGLREQYAKGLEAMGYKRVEGRTERYWVFYKDGVVGNGSYIFLGKAGAVRVGSRNAVTDTFAVGEGRKREILRRAGEVK